MPAQEDLAHTVALPAKRDVVLEHPEHSIRVVTNRRLKITVSEIGYEEVSGPDGRIFLMEAPEWEREFVIDRPEGLRPTSCLEYEIKIE